MIGTQMKSAFAQRHSTQVQNCEQQNWEREIWAKREKRKSCSLQRRARIKRRLPETPVATFLLSLLII